MSRLIKNQGLSLVELLVAITILTTLLTSIVVLFTTSLRVMRQGTQSGEGYEIARNVFNVIEHDLTLTNAARDFGDNDQFYGNPFGMTFVGVTGNNTTPDAQFGDPGYGDAAAASSNNMSRITYVLHLDRPRAMSTTDEVRVPTFSLLRYVEPGVSDLDSFRIMRSDGSIADLQWLADLQASEGNPAMDNLLEMPVDCTDCGDLTEPEYKRIQMRNLWIRVLAGDPTLAPPGLAGFWRDPAAPPGGDLRPDSKDYVVADHIVFPDADTIDNDGDGFVDEPDEFDLPDFFQYGAMGENGINDIHLTREWNDRKNLPYTGTATPYGAIYLGSPQQPRIPEVVHVKIAFAMASPFPGASDFRPQPFQQTIDVPSGYIRLPGK